MISTSFFINISSRMALLLHEGLIEEIGIGILGSGLFLDINNRGGID